MVSLFGSVTSRIGPRNSASQPKVSQLSSFTSFFTTGIGFDPNLPRLHDIFNPHITIDDGPRHLTQQKLRMVVREELGCGTGNSRVVMTKILVLEDDDHFRSVLVEALEDEGYSVTGCGSGDEAVNKARHEEFTLIVADIKMKGMDGLGAVSLIQSLQPEMSSLVVTGFADTIERARADNLCLDGFLKKPFDLDLLLDQVETLVQQQTSGKAEAQADTDRLTWARWVNDREGRRLKSLGRISASDFIAITRSLSNRIGLDGFESEQLLSGQLWLASRANHERSVPDPLKRFLGPESQGLLLEAGLALRTLFSEPKECAPDYLLSLIEELKENQPSGAVVETSLLKAAHLLFQRGDYQACSKALEDFFSTEAAFGRNRIRGQVLRAHLLLRSDRPEKARQAVKRMMESARQDGPLALSEACLAAGLFLLQSGSIAEAQPCYKEAGKACLALNLESEARACTLVLDLLKAPHLTKILRDQLIVLATPPLQSCLASFRQTLELTLRRWNLSFQEAVEGASPAEQLPQKPRIELHSLGKFSAFYNGEEIPKAWWRSAKARQLFCYLALDRGRLSEESLIEQFWPGDPTKGKNNLYTAASYIRGALRKAGLKADPLVRAGGALEISKEVQVWHDCSELLAAKDSNNPADRRRAVTLYNGSFLPDCYMDWAEDAKRQIDDAVLEISLNLASEALAREQMGEAIECGRIALSLSNCLDEAHVIVMTALLKQNRFLEVVRHYENCQQIYRLELESSPPIDVERVYHQARLSL